MAKSKKQTRKSSIILFIITISIIVVSSYFSISNLSKYDNLNKDKKEIKKEISKIHNEYKVIKEAKDKIKEELTEIKDMDKKISTTKEEVFKLAKKVEDKISKKETDYKIAYITFDDGPYYLTNNVLSLLKEKKVKATFFTIGAGKDTCFDRKSESCKETYKLEVDNGHTIANHTYSHSIFNGLYSSVDNFMEQIGKQEDLIYERTGVKTNIMRFPGGSVTAGRNKDAIIEKLREKGYGWVDWTAQDGDGGNLTSRSQAWHTFTGSIDENIEVILFHDYNDITYSILSDAIDYLEKNNYILLPLFYDSVMVNK